MVDVGFFGVSVFAALDGDVRALCDRTPRLRSPGTIWLATSRRVRSMGFGLVPTDASPHFDIVLPDVEAGTIEELIACFRPVPNGQAVVMGGNTMLRQLTVDFNRVVSDDLVRGNARHATPGTVIDVGLTLIVGDDDWGVVPAEVVEFDSQTGALVLRLLAELEPESAVVDEGHRAAG